MKNIKGWSLLVVVAIIFSACNQNSNSDAPVQFTSFEDSVSYSYGVQIAESMKRQNLENINGAILGKAINDVFADNPKLTVAECQGILQKFDQQKSAEIASKALEEGNAYLAQNKAKAGVTETESGLQYREIVAGTGITPVATDQVTVHYTGKLIDGTVFDSSVERGEPIQFGLNGVIAGWTEGLQLMKEGGKAELVIPSDLGYGPRGAGQRIPPNSVLVFEVELISVDR